MPNVLFFFPKSSKLFYAIFYQYTPLNISDSAAWKILIMGNFNLEMSNGNHFKGEKTWKICTMGAIKQIIPLLHPHQLLTHTGPGFHPTTTPLSREDRVRVTDQGRCLGSVDEGDRRCLQHVVEEDPNLLFLLHLSSYHQAFSGHLVWNSNYIFF